MKIKNIIVSIALAVVGTASHADVINFDDQTVGPHSDFYFINGVQFTDSVSNFVFVLPNRETNGSNSLSTPTDDDSFLNIFFYRKLNHLSFDFGNDDPRTVVPGDQAMLYLFLEGQFIAFVAMDLNGDDIANQTISADGFEFDTALFVYTDSSGTPLMLSEVIDNLSFTPTVAEVPEPGTPLTIAIGLAGAVLARRVKKSAV